MMDAVQTSFRDFLRARQLKYTTERKTILQAVQQFGRPFEAEELLLVLRQMGDRVSKATVYRTLKHLLAAQLVNQIFFGSGRQCYYDYVGLGTGHDHLVDLDSGKVVAFSDAELVKLRDRIAEQLGFAAVSHRFQIMGRRKKPS